MLKRNLIASIIIIAILFSYSCKNNQKTELNPKWDYENINSEGKLIQHSYTFCSVVPQVIDYTYKTGTWTFYSPQKVKIAEGIFDVELVKIDDQGGCSYTFYKNSVDDKKWKFWDSNGKPIPTNKRDLDFILGK